MIQGKPTCGELFNQLYTAFAADEATRRAFVGGWLGGLAEKVHLGACRAAMVRPPAEHRPLVLRLARCVAGVYGLECLTVHDEVWLARDREAARDVVAACNFTHDSAAYHLLRASLCGVPAGEVDVRYHERRGGQ